MANGKGKRRTQDEGTSSGDHRVTTMGGKYLLREERKIKLFGYQQPSEKDWRIQWRGRKKRETRT